MTDERSADQIITDIFGLPPSKRECALITRGALLEGRILDQQEAIERLEQQLAEALDPIKTPKSMLYPSRRRKLPAGTVGPLLAACPRPISRCHHDCRACANSVTARA